MDLFYSVMTAVRFLLLEEEGIFLAERLEVLEDGQLRANTAFCVCVGVNW